MPYFVERAVQFSLPADCYRIMWLHVLSSRFRHLLLLLLLQSLV
jgi:hypothetical protein